MMRAALREHGLRVRIIENQRVLPPPIKPATLSPTRKHRDAVAGQMIELADAKKRYKSPG